MSKLYFKCSCCEGFDEIDEARVNPDLYEIIDDEEEIASSESAPPIEENNPSDLYLTAREEIINGNYKNAICRACNSKILDSIAFRESGGIFYSYEAWMEDKGFTVIYENDDRYTFDRGW